MISDVYGLERLEPRQLLANGPLLLSEFMAANASSTNDQFDERPDWIEIYNPTAAPFSVANWHLTDDAENLKKWALPDTTVPAGGFLLVYASGRDLSDPQGELHANFRLSSLGEFLALIRPDNTVAHAYAPSFAPQQPDVSYGLEVVDGSVRADVPKFFSEPTPGAANGIGSVGMIDDLNFSVERSFFDSPIEVSITTETPETQIRFTTDGRLPTETNGALYRGPIRLEHTTVLRAAAFKEGHIPSKVETQSFLFPNDIVRQDAETALAAGLSTDWGRSRSSPGDNDPDFEMDPEVVDNPEYDVAASLRTLPTLSIVASGEDLFGRNGIYTNPARKGPNWERAASVELINPDGAIGFQVDAGLRIQGAFSRTHASKNGLRLVFKEEYGPSALQYPLFGDDAAARFNTLVLRAGFNDSWYSNIGPREAQYTRDEYNLRVQRAMGHETIGSSFMHVYLNGIYWGVYNVMERPDAAFGAEHFGGTEDQWDSINHNGVEDGNDEAWDQMLELAGDPTVDGFLRLQGIDAADPNAEVLLDMDNFIDYVIGNIYTGNTDWPHKNWYATRRRGPDSSGFQFYSWDAELSVNLANWSRLTTNHTRLCGNPSADRCEDLFLIYDPLRNNPEFRLRFADRVHKHFFNGGALYVDPDHLQWDSTHPERNRPAAMYHDVSEEIRESLIAESARWGDAIRRDSQPPYTLAEWQAELDEQLNEYFPDRYQIVLDQFRDPLPNSTNNADPLYPSVAAPVFNVNGAYQHGGRIDPTDTLTIGQPDGQTVYYTLDGSDPRLLGGAVSPDAQRTNTLDYVHGESSVRYLAAARIPNESQWRSVEFDDSSWNTGLAALGYDTGESEDAVQVLDGFSVRTVHSTVRLPDWNSVDRLLAGENVESETSVDGVPVINYHDRGRDGHFGINKDFPGGAGSDFALVASSAIVVRDAGTYTFGISSNDAARLRIDGAEVIFDQERHRTQDSLATVELTAGPHDLEMTMFNLSGSSTIELFVATGRKEEFDDDFVLLGDDTNGSFDEFIRSDVGDELKNTSVSLYVRVPFVNTGETAVDSLALELQYDDGFVAYLNGVEVARSNAPLNPRHDSKSSSLRDDSMATTIQRFDLSDHVAALRSGENVLSIHVLNADVDDPDLLLVPRLIAGVPPDLIQLGHATTVKARTFSAGTWSALNEAIYTSAMAPEPGDLRISEVHYHPHDLTADEMAAGFDDADSFEYIELLNVGERALDLSDVRLVKSNVDGEEQGVAFQFSNGDVTVVPAGERVVVVEDVQAFRFRYGQIASVAGQWTGGLSNASETITLTASLGGILQQLTYRDDWYSITDGNGPSLEIVDALDLNLANWGLAERWRASLVAGGTPGAPSVRVVGDSNHDGVFNSLDLVAVLMAGEYDDGISGNSTFETGDWNGDGDFDRRDIVFVLAEGKYTVNQ